MDAYRQAAICLHGLEDHDRDWLLSRLPKEHSAVLTGLLSELKMLGIPRETSLSRDLLPDSDAAANRGALKTDLAELEQASPEAVWSLLRNEPDSVLRALIMDRDWAWRGYVLKRYRKKHRRGLTAGGPAGSKVFQAIVSIMAKRLRESGGFAARHASETSWHQRLRKGLWPR